jgi:oligopeptide transport system substrate-binding protein
MQISVTSFRLTLLLLVTIFVAGCGKDEAANQQAGKGGKKLGGTYTLNLIRGMPGKLDPVQMTSKTEDDIAGNIFDKLIDNNDKLELEPELANRWEVSEDGKIYTFYLRNDVRFHDNACFPNNQGRLMTAHDIKYSFERICDPKAFTAGYWIFQDIVEGADAYFNGRSKDTATAPKGVTGFKVVNDTTFQCILTAPYAPFLQHLTTSFGYIVPHEAMEKYGKDIFRNPVGTGPFILDQWAEDQHITLKKNPKYWQKDEDGNQLPLLDAVKYLFIKDDKTVMANFERGSMDENISIPSESIRNFLTTDKKLTEKYKDKYELQRAVAMNSHFFDFMTASGRTFSNVNLRRALSFAVNRAQIVKHILKDAPSGPAHYGIVPPAFEKYPVKDVKGVSFNLDSAKYYLDKAGYPGGKGMPKIVVSIYNDPTSMQVAQAVQNMWQQYLGANVELQIMQLAQFLTASEEGKLDVWLTRWYADYPDVENFLNLFNGKLVPSDMSQKSYPNSTRWKNDEFVKVFYQALATNDETERMRLYAQAENISVQESPTIPLFYAEHIRLLQKHVRDNPLDPMNRVDLKRVWLDK